METKHVIMGAIVVVAILSLPLFLAKDKNAPAPVTRMMYDQITMGLSYPQVVEIVGRDGLRIEMTVDEAQGLKDLQGKVIGYMANQNFTVMGWKNSKGSARGDDPRIFVIFANGRVVAKKQIGLQ